MLLTAIGPGANLFITIVAILAAFGAGISIIDFLNTKEENEKLEE
jgi:hypothetical protein